MPDGPIDRTMVGAEWRQGSLLVLTAFMGSMAVMPAIFSLASMVEVLDRLFGWTRAQVTGAQAIYSLGSVAVMPVVGWAADRIGARRVVLLGLLTFPVAVVLMGLAGPSYASWVFAWILASISGQLVASPVWSIGVATRFRQSRGLALGVTACGTGIANTCVPLIAVTTVRDFAWRDFYFGLAAFIVLVILPLAWLFFYDAGDLAAKTSGRPLRTVERGASGDSGFATALRSRVFWGLAAIFVATSITTGTLLIHTQLIFRSMGLTAEHAAGIAGFIGIGGLIGRAMGGWMLDRFPKGPWIAAPVCLFPALASLILLTTDGSSSPLLALAALLAGFSMGLELDMLPYMVSRYFGLQSFGSLYLTYSAAFVVSSGCAPFVASLIYQRTGSNDVLLIFNMVVSLVAILILAMMPAYHAASKSNVTTGDDGAPDFALAEL